MSTPAARFHRPAVLLLGALVGVGLCWGATQPLSRVAATGGLHPVGLTFWQALIAAVVLTVALRARGIRLPLSPTHLRFYAVCGFLGTALPHVLSFTAARHLPAGIISILMATVPMMTLVLTVSIGRDRPEARRVAGLALGLFAVGLIVLPGTSLPSPDLAIWVLLPLAAALCYAGENTWIDAARPGGLPPLATLAGLSWAALIMVTPLLMIEGSWLEPWRLGVPETAFLASTLLHITAYLGLIWLIGAGGAVFAAQVGYVVMASGVVIGMIALGERHPWTVWLAFALMAGGVALVKPRR